MNSIKNALTRKFGPLPAYAWLGIAAVGIWWYRKRQAATGQTTGQSATGSIPYVGPWGQQPYPIGGGGGGGNGGGGNGGGGDGNGGPGPGGGPPPIPIGYKPPKHHDHDHGGDHGGHKHHHDHDEKHHPKHKPGMKRERKEHTETGPRRHPATHQHSGTRADHHTTGPVPTTRARPGAAPAKTPRPQVKHTGSAHPNSARRHK